MKKTTCSVIAVVALTGALCAGALAGCAPQSTTKDASTTTENTAAAPAAPEVNTTNTITSGTATEADIESRCLCCHLSTDLDGWNKYTVDAAMVESMIPTLSDDDINALAAYFATIEPQAQGEQH